MIIFKKISYAQKYHDDNAIPDVVRYICQTGKTPSRMIGGVGIDMNHIAESMIAVSKQFGKYSRIRLHHFVVSFPDGLKKPELLPNIAQHIANCIGRNYQIVYAVHEDTKHLHIHFVFNAVSYIDGTKYRGGMKEYYELIGCVSSILSVYHLYPLVPVKYNPEQSQIHE